MGQTVDLRKTSDFSESGVKIEFPVEKAKVDLLITLKATSRSPLQLYKYKNNVLHTFAAISYINS